MKNALITDKNKSGLGAAFDVLETRIRHHGTALTDKDTPTSSPTSRPAPTPSSTC